MITIAKIYAFFVKTKYLLRNRNFPRDIYSLPHFDRDFPL
jgi:hypothetical protein